MQPITPKPKLEPRDDIVIGRGAISELLKTDRQVECIYLQRGLSGTITKIAAIAKSMGIPCKEVDIRKLDHMCGHSNHQGVVAQTSAARYSELEEIFERAKQKDQPPFIIIADEIEDPHNLGAIIRTAEAAGADGLIIPKRRSAGLSFAVSKVSAGASEHLPVVRVTNLSSTVEELKKRGLWIYAADMDGKAWDTFDYTGPVALIIGSEGSGVSRVLKEKSDFVVSIPIAGKIGSLNASVAAGIIIYEIVRGRRRGK